MSELHVHVSELGKVEIPHDLQAIAIDFRSRLHLDAQRYYDFLISHGFDQQFFNQAVDYALVYSACKKGTYEQHYHNFLIAHGFDKQQCAIAGDYAIQFAESYDKNNLEKRIPFAELRPEQVDAILNRFLEKHHLPDAVKPKWKRFYEFLILHGFDGNFIDSAADKAYYLFDEPADVVSVEDLDLRRLLRDLFVQFKFGKSERATFCQLAAKMFPELFATGPPPVEPDDNTEDIDACDVPEMKDLLMWLKDHGHNHEERHSILYRLSVSLYAYYQNRATEQELREKHILTPQKYKWFYDMVNPPSREGARTSKEETKEESPKLGKEKEKTVEGKPTPESTQDNN